MAQELKSAAVAQCFPLEVVRPRSPLQVMARVCRHIALGTNPTTRFKAQRSQDVHFTEDKELSLGECVRSSRRAKPSAAGTFTRSAFGAQYSSSAKPDSPATADPGRRRAQGDRPGPRGAEFLHRFGHIQAGSHSGCRE